MSSPAKTDGIGIKTIPDKIAEGEVSVSTSEVRAKPWETEREATEVSFFSAA